MTHRCGHCPWELREGSGLSEQADLTPGLANPLPGAASALCAGRDRASLQGCFRVVSARLGRQRAGRSSVWRDAKPSDERGQ